jgi:GNAT superfamily N-acetyltransferase
MNTSPVPGVEIRPLAPADSFAEMTALLHAAYAPLAAAGMRFWATHQDEAVTRERATEGECWVAVETGTGRMVGTIALRLPGTAKGCAWFERADVAVCGQFGVAPEWKGRGLGAALMRVVEERAREMGAAELAGDTAESADHLLAMYERWGFRRVGHVQWDGVNYRSVLLSKRLAP